MANKRSPASAHPLDVDAVRMGKALKALRLRAGVTQDQASSCADPPMSTQYWGMHEAGKVRGIFLPVIQRKLVEALNLAGEPDPPIALEDFGAEAARLAAEPGAASLNMPPRQHAKSREAIFPTRDGDIVLFYPHRLTRAGIEELENYLTVFLRSLSAT